MQKVVSVKIGREKKKGRTEALAVRAGWPGGGLIPRPLVLKGKALIVTGAAEESQSSSKGPKTCLKKRDRIKARGRTGSTAQPVRGAGTEKKAFRQRATET